MSSPPHQNRHHQQQRFPRHLTFRPGELDDRYRGLLKLPPGAPLPLSVIGPTSGSNGKTGRGRLIKTHAFPVAYPDGTEGTCTYERGGPVWHLFKMKDADGAMLPVQYVTQRMENTLPAIEAKGRELTDACYRAAVERERKEYFQRAAESPYRRKRRDRCRMTTARAKELSGRYSVCLHLRSGSLIPIGESFAPTWDGLREANEAWHTAMARRPPEDHCRLVALVVGCCNRLDRCWEMPRYNPLNQEYRSTAETYAAEANMTDMTDETDPIDRLGRTDS